jgi:hypothetical protein
MTPHEQLLAHPNWHKVGPVSRAVLETVALCEADAETGVFSFRSIPELARAHGFTPRQVKQSFEVARKHGIAMYEERFVRGKYGSRQVGSVYRLKSDAIKVRDHKRVKRALVGVQRKERVRAGRLLFTPAEERQLDRQLRNRPRPHIEHREALR